MQYFNVSYECSEGVRSVKQWLKNKDEWIERDVRKLEAAQPLLAPASFFSFILCFIACALGVERHWHDGIIIAFAILGLLGVIVAFISIRKTHRKTDAIQAVKRAELEDERDQDPFYQCARLIVRANEGFAAHSHRYWLHCRQVHEGLRLSDRGLEDAYLLFLVRAEETLTRASQNFLEAVDLAERRRVFEEKHPRIHTKPEDTALGTLMAQLGDPANIPQVPELPDAREALEYEEALRGLEVELRGDIVRQS